MTSEQRPLGSGLSAAATADEVLAGADLSGVDAIVTGGHSGIGLATTRALARAGATVTVPARDVGRATSNLVGIERVEVQGMDLLDPHSISEFVSRWHASGRELHILINNAAVPTPGSVERDARGFEVQFATSHLGHFQLTVGLHESLRKAGGARVVNVSSGAHRLTTMRWHDLNFTQMYDPLQSYAQAKLANVLFAVALDRRWASDGIRGYAVHPGVVLGTQLNRGGSVAGYQAMGLLDQLERPIIDPSAGKKTAEQGAATPVFAATSAQLRDIGGVYLKDCDIAPIDDRPLTPTADFIPADAISHALDPVAADRLWELSEKLLSAP